MALDHRNKPGFTVRYAYNLMMPPLCEQFGEIDIYLFDQILRGRIAPGMRIFDAGCGYGRNLVYFLREKYAVAGADIDPEAVAFLRNLAAQYHPGLPDGSFRVEKLEKLSFEAESADVVISNAVLHFASCTENFVDMLMGSWRVLAVGGLFFCRLASTIGLETRVEALGRGRYLLPDGSLRFLANEGMLERVSNGLGGEFLDPLKTTVVQNQRSMTTWVLRKTSLGTV